VYYHVKSSTKKKEAELSNFHYHHWLTDFVFSPFGFKEFPNPLESIYLVLTWHVHISSIFILPYYRELNGYWYQKEEKTAGGSCSLIWKTVATHAGSERWLIFFRNTLLTFPDYPFSFLWWYQRKFTIKNSFQPWAKRHSNFNLLCMQLTAVVCRVEKYFLSVQIWSCLYFVSWLKIIIGVLKIFIIILDWSVLCTQFD